MSKDAVHSTVMPAFAYGEFREPVVGSCARWLVVALVGVAVAGMGLSPLSADHPDQPEVRKYKNCQNLWEAGWYNGVREGGGSYESSWDDHEKATYGKNPARDRDKDGWACEVHDDAPVALGVGLMAVYPFESSVNVPDGDNRVSEAERAKQSMRPALVFSYLFPRRIEDDSKRVLGSRRSVRFGVSALVSVEDLLSEQSIAKANGIGVGIVCMFRTDERKTWKNGFGIGLGYLREANLKRLRPGSTPLADPVVITKPRDSLVLTLTWSLGKGGLLGRE